MRTLIIAKRSGGTRVVVASGKRRKAECRRSVARITEKAAEMDPLGVAHGFVRGRSPVTMAEAHVGHQFTMSFDLADCFDHVTADKLGGKLEPYGMHIALVDGVARQGLPTSPACANLAMVELDQAILGLLDEIGGSVVYTRYADDLVFSFDDPALIPVLWQRIPEIATGLDWPINRSKTRVQSAKAGRRMICGIAVGQDGIHPSRDVRRRLRAARHQGNEAQARGLAEWAALKLPRAERARRGEADGIAA